MLTYSPGSSPNTPRPSTSVLPAAICPSRPLSRSAEPLARPRSPATLARHPRSPLVNPHRRATLRPLSSRRPTVATLGTPATTGVAQARPSPLLATAGTRSARQQQHPPLPSAPIQQLLYPARQAFALIPFQMGRCRWSKPVGLHRCGRGGGGSSVD